MASLLKLVSYNSHGSGCGRLEFIDKLLQSNDFILIQEHWLQECQFVIYDQSLVSVCHHCVSGMNPADINRCGKPFGGCAILWKKNIKM